MIPTATLKLCAVTDREQRGPRRKSTWAYYAQLSVGIVVVVAAGVLGFAAVRMLR
jgi:hypothetical protein